MVDAYFADDDGTVAQCTGCLEKYTAEEWQKLPLVGVQDFGEVASVELRNCPCLERSGIRGAYTIGAEVRR